ncbi:MAG TPA: PEP-CTERM sorting domain-containing protein [Chthoniobacterales bacterium]|nr:PEP-CTERM sorting domain-containing protein [Chthoniobacterales bacterium]
MESDSTYKGPTIAMIKQLTSALFCTALIATSAFAAAPAADNSGNYPNGTADWFTGSNGGTGFGAWTITDGDGGHYIGGTGLGANTFGLFNTFTTTTTSAERPFTGVLAAGETFSIDLGFTPFSGGAVGLNLRSGTEDVFTLFTNGSGDWMLNDGGSDFSAGAAATANTPYTFSLTYNGGNSYSFTLTGSAGGTNFTSSDPLIGSIDNVRLFDFNQGAGQNFGFDNLSVVPEPSTLSLLAGPMLLGGWFFVRRRRNS